MQLNSNAESFRQITYEMEHFVVEIEGIHQSAAPELKLVDRDWEAIVECGLIIEENGEVRLAEGTENESRTFNSLDLIRRRTGNWYGIYRNSLGQIIVANDFFSYRTVYYSIQDDRLYVGSNFRGVRQCLNNSDTKSLTDWANYLPYLATTTNLFRTRASNATFDSRISTLWHRHLLIVTPHGVAQRHYPLPQTPNLDYEELLSVGINRATNSFKSFEKLHLPLILSLSGGKDSRTVLSLFLASGSILPELTTRSPKGVPPGFQRDVFSQDFTLALHLAERYGLKWQDKSRLSTDYFGFDDSLFRWQRFRSNNSFEITPSISVSGSLETAIVSVMGMGGELYRSYLGGEYHRNMTTWWNEAAAPENDAIEGLRRLFVKLVRPWSIPSKFYEKAQEHFIQAFLFPGIRNAIDALDEGYWSYRNPAHTGAFDYNLSANIITFYPLSQPEFYWASRQLSFEDQQDGRLLYDLMRLIDSNLLGLPFNSPRWPERFSMVNRDSSWDNINLSRQLSAYEAANSSPQQIHFPSDRRKRDGSFDEHIKARVTSNLSKIFEEGNLPLDMFRSGLSERFFRTMQASGNAAVAMLGKTESMIDAIETRHEATTIAKIKLGNHERPITEDFRNLHKDYSVLSIESQLQKFDLTKVRVEISFATNQLIVNPFNVPDGYETAAYLYRDGSKVEVQMYGMAKSTGEFHFTPTGPGIYRATLFVRAIGLPEASRVIETEEITVE